MKRTQQLKFVLDKNEREPLAPVFADIPWSLSRSNSKPPSPVPFNSPNEENVAPVAKP